MRQEQALPLMATKQSARPHVWAMHLATGPRPPCLSAAVFFAMRALVILSAVAVMANEKGWSSETWTRTPPQGYPDRALILTQQPRYNHLAWKSLYADSAPFLASQTSTLTSQHQDLDLDASAASSTLPTDLLTRCDTHFLMAFLFHPPTLLHRLSALAYIVGLWGTCLPCPLLIIGW